MIYQFLLNNNERCESADEESTPSAVDIISVTVGEMVRMINCIVCYVKFIGCNNNAEYSLFIR